MGRHETFHDAAPLAEGLLAGTSLGSKAHPDARLMELEQKFLVARAEYDAAISHEDDVDAEFKRREQPYVEADKVLLMWPDSTHHWQAKHIRMIFAGKHPGGSAKDYELIRSTSRAELERLLPLATARDERREALNRELGFEGLEKVREALLCPTDKLAKAVYRTRARSLEGLGVKARPQDQRTGPLETAHGQ